MNKHATRAAFVSVFSLALVALGAQSASAAPATLTPTSETGMVASAADSTSGVENDLEALSATQTPSEAEEIWTSDKPAVALLDDDGSVISAAYTEPEDALSALSISIVGPGCTLTSACLITTSNVHNGYEGTGSRAINIGNVKTLQAGDIKTTFTRNSGTQYVIQPQKQGILKNPGTITRIAR